MIGMRFKINQFPPVLNFLILIIYLLLLLFLNENLFVFTKQILCIRFQIKN